MKLSDLKRFTQSLPPQAYLNDTAWRNVYLRSLGLDPGNLYQELEMDSRFVNTHRDTSYAAAGVNLHSHTFYEMLFCRSCEGVEYLVGTERYRLREGDVIMVPPGVSHRPLLPADLPQPYIRDVLWLSVEFVQQLQQWLPELGASPENYRTVLHTKEDVRSAIGKLFEQGVREAESDADDRELAIIGNTVTLLTQLHRAYAARSARPMQAERPELLDRVMAYVEVHLEEKIALSQIAHHFYVSDSTISHLFKQKMGVSFYRYVTQRRLIAAKTLIEKGLSMENVACKTGFSDYSGFYRAFRQEYGISPRQYRDLQEK